MTSNWLRIASIKSLHLELARERGVQTLSDSTVGAGMPCSRALPPVGRFSLHNPRAGRTVSFRAARYLSRRRGVMRRSLWRMFAVIALALLGLLPASKTAAAQG